MILKTSDIIAVHDDQLAPGGTIIEWVHSLDQAAQILKPYIQSLVLNHKGSKVIATYSVQVGYKKPFAHLTLFLASGHWVDFVTDISAKPNCRADSCHLDSSEIGYVLEAARIIARTA